MTHCVYELKRRAVALSEAIAFREYLISDEPNQVLLDLADKVCVGASLRVLQLADGLSDDEMKECLAKFLKLSDERKAEFMNRLVRLYGDEVELTTDEIDRGRKARMFDLANESFTEDIVVSRNGHSN